MSSDRRPPSSALKSPSADEGWTTVITPHRGWLDWRLHQLWRYRDLISLFVWRDFVSLTSRPARSGMSSSRCS